MNIGKLNRRITLVEMGKTSDGGGGGKPFPLRQMDVWGDFRKSGNRSSAGSGTLGKAYDVPVIDETHYVYIRRNSAPQVDRGWQAIFEVRLFFSHWDVELRFRGGVTPEAGNPILRVS